MLLKQNTHIESLRELLFSHKFFNLVDSFHLFDTDGEGKLSASHFEEGFAKYNITFAADNLQRFIDVLDEENDGLVDLREYTTMLTPASPDFKYAGKGSAVHLSVEQKQVFEQA